MRDVRHQQFQWQISGEPWPHPGIQTSLTAGLLPRMHGYIIPLSPIMLSCPSLPSFFQNVDVFAFYWKTKTAGRVRIISVL